MPRKPKSKATTIILPRKQYTGISLGMLYDSIARACKKNPNDPALSYDCNYIKVSRSIQDAIFDHMRENGASKTDFGSMWAKYGPKAYEELPDGTVIVEPKFFVYSETMPIT
jgi:hypothetical protein